VMKTMTKGVIVLFLVLGSANDHLMRLQTVRRSCTVTTVRPISLSHCLAVAVLRQDILFGTLIQPIWHGKD
jgi:hypothetical protein